MHTVLTNIYQLAVKLLEPLSEQETYAVILSEAERLVGANEGTVYLVNRKKEFDRAFSTVPKELQVTPRHEGYAYETYKTRKIKIVNFRQLKKTHPERQYPHPQYIVMIPLSYNKKAIGVIVLHTEKLLVLSNKKTKILELFSSMATLKIRNNMLFSEAKTAVETRDLFISMASHELKTPLTTISAYAQLIQKRVSNKQEVKEEWLTVLSSATMRMTRLINELLHVNQIKTGKLPYSFAICNLLDVAEQAATEFKNSNKKNQLIFKKTETNPELTLVRGDFDKLFQVVTNVLNNAAKFSPAENSVLMSLSSKKSTVTLSITDQGKGISDEHLPFLFSEFYKADNNIKEGLGLGLFISKKIVEAHRGTIKVKSQVGKGSTFIVSIPLAKKI